MLRGAISQVATGARALAQGARQPIRQAATQSAERSSHSTAAEAATSWRTQVRPIDETRRAAAPDKAFGVGGRLGHRNTGRSGGHVQQKGKTAGNRGRQGGGGRGMIQPTKGLRGPQGHIWNEEYICTQHELPRASDYGLEREPVDHATEILATAGLTMQRKTRDLPGRSQYLAQTTLTIDLDDGLMIECLGHGKTRTQSAANADLHAIALLHKRGLLKSILPGGEFASVSKQTLQQHKDARIDIVNFAARHDCLPTFSVRARRSRLQKNLIHRAKVEIPKLNLVASGTGATSVAAETAACAGIKMAAEQQHEQTGDGTLLVKDYTKLTTASAKQFVDYYCFVMRIKHELDLKQSGKLRQWRGKLTISGMPAEQPAATDGATTSAEAAPRVFEGVIAGDNKKDGEDLTYIAAALALKQESPDVWRKFVKEMKRGSGEVLKELKPIDIDVDFDAISIMRTALREVKAVEQPLEMDAPTADAKIPSKQGTQRHAQSLTHAQHTAKSAELKNRLARYESAPELADLRAKREALPMVQYRDQVMQLVLDNDICVVVGATGSGKTTQLPQLILEHEIRQGAGSACNIICTQPRRIAAISVAQRVSVERDEKLQESIGHQVRFDAKLPVYGGSVTYCTTGILLRQLQDNQDATLDSVSHIIVDEVHERDIQIDFLLVLLKQLLKARREAGKPPVKLVLMSATIDTTLFCKYFGESFPGGRCPFIEVPGRTFPVTQHPLEEIVRLLKSYDRREVSEFYSRDSQQYLQRELAFVPSVVASAPVSERNSEDGDDRAVINWKSQGVVGEDGELDVAIEKEDTMTPVGLMSLTIAHLLKTTTEGSILVFLPGLAEITALNKLLTHTDPLGVPIASDPNYKVYMLHSAIPQMQQEVFEKLGPGQRKIILSTNIAETSITIPDVVYVVDSGKHRETQYDQAKRISALISTWISKSNSRQRAGRAGRVQHGHYYSMISTARQEALELAAQPEILRTDLQELCLQIKGMNVADIRGFLNQAIEPPSMMAVEASIDHLQALGALDEEEGLTPLGRVLALLPVQPSLGKMVLLGSLFKCVDPALIMAAAATVKDPFVSPLDKRAQADACKQNLSGGTGSDVLAVVNAFQRWRQIRGEQGTAAAKSYCFENFLQFSTMIQLAQTCEQTMETVVKAGFLAWAPRTRHTSTQYGSDEENVHADSSALRAALATAGFYPNLAVQTHNARVLQTASENNAAIHPSSLAAPKTDNGRMHGRILPESVLPYGAMFVYAQKTQGDGKQVSLRGCTRTSPLAVVLFGGQARSDGPLIRVDEWVPFYARGPQHHVTIDMAGQLESYLARTFGNLGSASLQHVLGRDGGRRRGESPLTHDPVRAPLVRGIVGALDQAYKSIVRRRPSSFAHGHGQGYGHGHGYDRHGSGRSSLASSRAPSVGRSSGPGSARGGARQSFAGGSSQGQGDRGLEYDFADLFGKQKRK